jgi:hypothetical protein
MLARESVPLKAVELENEMEDLLELMWANLSICTLQERSWAVQSYG